ncbi:MAG: hypothetical protein HGA45_41440 [Chloroflexales bacterium]|nr:hypothetical protein [Chloroflexales bacterium]
MAGATRCASSSRLLASAYRSGLALATQHGLGSVAFPSISTGLFGYPLEEAVPVALAAARYALAEVSGVQPCRPRPGAGIGGGAYHASYSVDAARSMAEQHVLCSTCGPAHQHRAAADDRKSSSMTVVQLY